MEEHFFDVAALAASLPETSGTMLRDLRLTDEAAASCRIFRAYHATPLHYHTACDEYLYVLQGRAILELEGMRREIGPGELVFFRKRAVHGTPEILEHPFVVLAVDTPRRPPEDVHFLHPSEGSVETFLETSPVPIAKR